MAILWPVSGFEVYRAGLGVERCILNGKAVEISVHARARYARPNHARQVLSIPVEFKRNCVSVIEGRSKVANPRSGQRIAAMLGALRCRARDQHAQGQEQTYPAE